MSLNGNVFYAKHQFVLFVVRVMWKNLMNDNMAFAPKRKLKRMTMKIRKEMRTRKRKKLMRPRMTRKTRKEMRRTRRRTKKKLIMMRRKMRMKIILIRVNQLRKEKTTLKTKTLKKRLLKMMLVILQEKQKPALVVKRNT